MEKTLSIIKPDSVEKNNIGKILQRFEENDLKIVAIKMLHLSSLEAKKFYQIHSQKPFFNELIEFMSSGPIVVLILEGKEAVLKNRKIMGDTNPKNAEMGTIRKDFATNITENAVHGSDSLENAEKEIKFFFTEKEIYF